MCTLILTFLQSELSVSVNSIVSKEWNTDNHYHVVLLLIEIAQLDSGTESDKETFLVIQGDVYDQVLEAETGRPTKDSWGLQVPLHSWNQW